MPSIPVTCWVNVGSGGTWSRWTRLSCMVCVFCATGHRSSCYHASQTKHKAGYCDQYAVNFDRVVFCCFSFNRVTFRRLNSCFVAFNCKLPPCLCSWCLQLSHTLHVVPPKHMTCWRLVLTCVRLTCGYFGFDLWTRWVRWHRITWLAPALSPICLRSCRNHITVPFLC